MLRNADFCQGYCRAFVQFQAVDDAVVFVKEHFPSLLVTLPHPTDEAPDGKVELYLHFARSQGDLEQLGGPPPAIVGDWVCPQVFISPVHPVRLRIAELANFTSAPFATLHRVDSAGTAASLHQVHLPIDVHRKQGLQSMNNDLQVPSRYSWSVRTDW